MPEGDTLFRTAIVLNRALAGGVVTRFEAAGPAVAGAPLIGRTVTGVSARGKNLLINFDDGSALHSHLRMEGSWHVYRPGEPWQKPERQARAVLGTERYVAVCFNAPVVEWLTATGLARHEGLAGLGPDLLAPDFDESEAIKRLRSRNNQPIGEAIMRQDTVAGIGNVYKSEVLFLCGLNPFGPVSGLTDEALRGVVERARRLMKANLGGGDRVTRFRSDGARQWVYGRQDELCLKCGTRIQMRRQGEDGRSTYWCPACQPE